MKVAQCSFNYLGHELWLDLFVLPHGLNNIEELQKAGALDMLKDEKEFRIVEVIEGKISCE